MLRVKILTLQQISEMMKPYWNERENRKNKAKERDIIENPTLGEKRKQRIIQNRH